jgi:hypothetical protein
MVCLWHFCASTASIDIQRRQAEEVTMPPETLRVRVDRLERRVEILEQLPDRVSALESQIVLLRNEMRSEFSVMQVRDLALTERMEFLFEANERHMRLLLEDLVGRIATLKEGR